MLGPQLRMQLGVNTPAVATGPDGEEEEVTLCFGIIDILQVSQWSSASSHLACFGLLRSPRLASCCHTLRLAKTAVACCCHGAA